MIYNFIKETIKNIGALLVVIYYRKKIFTLHFLQYVKLPINAYRVIAIFELSEVYLIDPAKKIFRKFPKLDFLKNILILSLKFYYIELTQLTKNTVLGYV